VAAADVLAYQSQPLEAMRLLATVPSAVWAWAAGSWHGTSQTRTCEVSMRCWRSPAGREDLKGLDVILSIMASIPEAK
jgi:hypothetical protein